MPYPAQTDRDNIVQITRELIEKEGIEQLSLAQLAATVQKVFFIKQGG